MGTSSLLAFGEMKVDDGRVANHSFFSSKKMGPLGPRAIKSKPSHPSD